LLIKNQFLIAAEVDGDDNPVGGIAGFFGSGVCCCSELLCGFDSVPWRRTFVVQDLAEDCGCFCEQFRGRFASCIAIADASFVFGVYSEANCFVLDDFCPGVRLDAVFLADLLVAEDPFAIAGTIRKERSSNITTEWDRDASEYNRGEGVDLLEKGLGCTLPE
jgi:hypothetical protein